MVEIIGDVGSTHMGDKQIALDSVKAAKEAGLDAVKFQLFIDKPPNIHMPYEWMPDLVALGKDIGIEVFASVWDVSGIKMLKKCGCRSIKFAYSERKTVAIDGADCKRVFVSHDYADTPRGSHPLFCIPIYPVPYLIDFEKIYKKFIGFSDHTKGWQQTLAAIRAGAKVIEKHVNFNPKANCPDSMFALQEDETAKMVMAIRRVAK